MSHANDSIGFLLLLCPRCHPTYFMKLNITMAYYCPFVHPTLVQPTDFSLVVVANPNFLSTPVLMKLLLCQIATLGIGFDDLK